MDLRISLLGSSLYGHLVKSNHALQDRTDEEDGQADTQAQIADLEMV